MPDDAPVPIENLLRPRKPIEAREQALNNLGFMSGIPIDIGNGEAWECSVLMDEEQQRNRDQLDLDLESLDQEQVEIRDRVTVEYHDPETGKVLRTETRAGEVLRTESQPKMPHRRNGELVDHYDLRLCKALMGDEIYQKFKAAGGKPGDIGIWFTDMNKRINDRRAADSKSGSGAGAVGPVPPGDPG